MRLLFSIYMLCLLVVHSTVPVAGAPVSTPAATDAQSHTASPKTNLTAASALPIGTNPQRLLRPGKAQMDTPTETKKPETGGSTGTKPGNGSSVNVGAHGSPTGESYSTVAQLEEITFGQSHPDKPIADRLSDLEKTVFQKTFPNLSLDHRTQQLSETLLGKRVNPDFPAPPNHWNQPSGEYHEPLPMPPGAESATTTVQPSEPPADDPLWSTPEFQADLPMEQLEHFALQQVNEERAQRGEDPLQWLPLAGQVSKSHVDELTRRAVVSHLNETGENPDLRYTRAGGDDAVIEGLVVLSGEGIKKPNRAMVMRVMRALNAHQDDRDALLSVDATHFGIAFGWTKDHQKLISCSEVVTKRGIMQPIPREVHVGDKIEIKGIVFSPYEFNRVTVAWEGLNKGASSFEESDEAMPYFPPLDYVAHSTKREHGDHEKLMTVVKAMGIAAAIAGGMFIPPVALAAPLIAMSGPNVGEPHAVSEIPVHGGMKVEGSTFSGTVPINNDGKPGQYYVTIWANSPHNGHPVPISRRIIVAEGVDKEKPVKELKDATSEHQ